VNVAPDGSPVAEIVGVGPPVATTVKEPPTPCWKLAELPVVIAGASGVPMRIGVVTTAWSEDVLIDTEWVPAVEVLVTPGITIRTASPLRMVTLWTTLVTVDGPPDGPQR
jgi:hypothetical protein